MIGSIAAQKGILSTMADDIAATHIITTANTIGSLEIEPPGPKLPKIQLATDSRCPMCSSPPTITNKPAKNTNAVHSTFSIT